MNIFIDFRAEMAMNVYMLTYAHVKSHCINIGNSFQLKLSLLILTKIFIFFHKNKCMIIANNTFFFLYKLYIIYKKNIHVSIFFSEIICSMILNRVNKQCCPPPACEGRWGFYMYPKLRKWVHILRT